jgi:hypothetical protein
MLHQRAARLTTSVASSGLDHLGQLEYFSALRGSSALIALVASAGFDNRTPAGRRPRRRKSEIITPGPADLTHRWRKTPQVHKTMRSTPRTGIVQGIMASLPTDRPEYVVSGPF